MEQAAAKPAPSPQNPLPEVANLDGLYLTLGPVAAAVYTHGEHDWDGGFGGELMLLRVRENNVLSAIGLAAGGVHFAEAGNGRLWGDVVLANKTALGLGVGISGGLAVEVGDLQKPRFGWQATLWVYAGVIPYIRLGSLEQTGTFVDVGLKITLPALRW